MDRSVITLNRVKENIEKTDMSYDAVECWAIENLTSSGFWSGLFLSETYFLIWSKWY